MILWGHRFSQNANQKLQRFLSYPLINFQNRNLCHFWLAFWEKRWPLKFILNLTDLYQFQVAAWVFVHKLADTAVFFNKIPVFLLLVCLKRLKRLENQEFPRKKPFQKKAMKMQKLFTTRLTEISLTSFRWAFTPEPLLKRILARLLRLDREPGSLSLKYEQLDWWCWQRWKWKSRRKWQPGSTFNSTSKANFCAK